MEDNKKALEKIRNEYWYEFEKVEDKTPLTAEEDVKRILDYWGIDKKETFVAELSGLIYSERQQTASLQERVTQLESDKEQLHKVIVGHEETNIALSEQIAELEQRNKALEKCSDQQQKLIELDVKALNDLTQQNKNFIKWLELEIRDNAEWWQNPATLWQSFLKEHGLTEQPNEP